MNMIDPVAMVSPSKIRWFHNGMWRELPHSHFFVNNVRQHFEKSKRHMPKEQKQSWESVFRNKLQSGELLRVNHILFKTVEA